MKKWLLPAIALGLFVFVRPVSAHEGRISLTQGSVDCEAISVWQDGRYHIVGRCSGLVYPYGEAVTNYVLWAKTDAGQTIRVSTIPDGQIDAWVTDPFTALTITAESSDFPRQPDNTIVATGGLTALNLGTNQPSVPVITIAPQPLPTSAVAAPLSLTAPSFTAGRSTSVTLAIFVGFVLIIVAAIFVVRKIAS